MEVPLVVPVNDKVPASTLILALLFKVIVLVSAFTPVDPVKFLITPLLLTPVPKTVMASGIFMLVPKICITAPSETVVLLEPVPAFKLPNALDF